MPKILDTTERFGGPLPTCRCPKWGEACSAGPTAEDLLCDRCRNGCQLLAFGPPEEPRAVIRHVNISFALHREPEAC